MDIIQLRTGRRNNVLSKKKLRLCLETLLCSFACFSCAFKTAENPLNSDCSGYISGKTYVGIEIKEFQNIVNNYSYISRLALFSKTPSNSYPGDLTSHTTRFEGDEYIAFNCDNKTIFALFDKERTKISEVIETDIVRITKSECEKLGIFGEKNKTFFDYSFFGGYRTRYVALNYRKSSSPFELTYNFLKRFGAFDSVVVWPTTNSYDYGTYNSTNIYSNDIVQGIPAYTIYDDNLKDVYGVLTFDSDGYARTFLREDGCAEPLNVIEFYMQIVSNLIPDRCEYYFTPDRFDSNWRNLLYERAFYPEQKESFELDGKKYVYGNNGWEICQ